ncbi:hypothetical protein [Encephalitozoon cuniculi GB-M1]|uniref:Uncharacterized protein n=2 Tax=Encephalitozoon cuniculi TaxID=6035 RepID=Q8SV06_ENCCU|nr:uncharacterized protein ECU07_0850 [Encephalitozoon cuniculi GB-M1]AGE95902.1 hypothetical protein ECU07_0850 [Encephalitozoon cuniculi]KMV65809.1 hypothetical protein M970_070800 [Encephalitozoon cuniculi EcunIII-L]UYI27243.1 hypothetical protein J0A71_05g11010 [Encephalitozoon cuniculi]CAD25617.1 hypothetical protein [Encephalitozoon cuniculi GB-M1]
MLESKDEETQQREDGFVDGNSGELLPVDFYTKGRKPREDQKVEFMSGNAKDFSEGTGRVCFADVVNALETENQSLEEEIRGLRRREERISKENDALKDILCGLLARTSS